MHELLARALIEARIRDLYATGRPRIQTTPTLRHRLTRIAVKLRWETVPTPAADRITIRICETDETWAVERLAALEERPVPLGPLLVAEVGGLIEAALPVDGGDPLTNPFRPTTHLVSLLALRREQLVRAA